MAFPVLLKKLFKNEGAGPELRDDIIPKLDASKMPTDYLPTSGGTMSAGIKFSGDNVCLYRTTNDKGITIRGGGNSFDYGAGLGLYGKDHSTSAGQFALIANTGTTNATLNGKADGTLTWSGNNVLTTANGLPLSGGTMTGAIQTSNSTTVKQTSDGSYVGIYGGTAYNKGGYGVFYGIDHPENSGVVAFQTYGENTAKRLVLRPDGTFTWGGDNVITSAGGTMTGAIYGAGGLIRCKTDDADIWIGGGTNSSSNSYIQLNGGSRATNAGMIELVAKDTTNTSSLLAKPDGTLTWGGKNIVRSVNNTSADANGNVSITSVTKATQDSDGKAINTTYAKLAGATFTGAVKATSFQATSDSRLKDNIEPVKYRYALNALNSINTYSYNLKNDSIEGKRYGVIAQEVQEVLPEVVKQGNEEYYSVDYSGLTAICVAAINELTVRVQFLERQLAEITNQKETK